MKKLGFGLMRLPLLDPNNPASVDIEQLKAMVDLFMKKGFTYFDTAWMWTSILGRSTCSGIFLSRLTGERLW